MRYKNSAPTKTSLTTVGPIKLMLLGLAAVLAITTAVVPLATADRFDEEIKQLQSDNSNKSQQTNTLKVEADSLQATISGLQGQIDALTHQIAVNQNENIELQKQIEIAQAELEKQKDLLGQSIKAMYLEGDISTVEMLATSKNLSDYFDKQQYRDVVKSKIKTTLDTVTTLQAKLLDQQTRLQKLIDEQITLQSQLSSQRAEKDRLLNLNQSQQASLDKEIKDNFGKISDLKRQQALENAKLFGNGKIPAGVPGGGGYPGVWAFAPMDSMLDNWGMYNRECVSYTAWKVAISGRFMPGWGWAARGNANQWDDNARAAGISVNGTPKDGDIAVSNAGSYGHVMYVEATGESGDILVSDYNQQYDGLYRQYWISGDIVRARGLIFIHF